MSETTTSTSGGAAVVEDLTLDLDTLEREDQRPPFRFRHLGAIYEMGDPRDMDWQDQIRAETDPLFCLKALMPEGQSDALLETKLPAWKLQRIVDGFREHYKPLPAGESDGSST